MKLIARFLTFVFLHFTLSLFILAATITFVVTDRDTIKSAISEANVYQDIVPALIDNFEREEQDREPENQPPGPDGPDSTGSEEENGLSFDDPEIRKIFEDSITPEILQTEFEGFLDELYVWLEGERQQLTFEIDLSQVRTNLIDNATSYIIERTESLPDCTTVEQAEQGDVFNLECKPPGFTAAEAETEIRSGIEEFEILEDPKITQDTIKTDKNDEEPLEERLEPAKNVYSNLPTAFYGSSALFFAAIVVFLLARMPVGNAIGALGKHLLGSGAFLALGAFIAQFLVPRFTESIAAEEEGQLATVGSNVAEAYVGSVLSFTLVLGLVIAAIGLVAVMPHHLKKLTSGSKNKK